MKLDEYVNFTDTVAIYSPTPDKPSERDKAYLGLGLAGEAGEVADEIKKSMRNGEDRTKNIALELGDVLYYWVRNVKAYGFTPEQIMDLNYEKLTERKKNDILKKR